MVARWLTISAEGERAITELHRLSVLVRRTRLSLGGGTAIRPARALQDDLNDAAIVRGWSIVEAYLRDRGEAILRREAPIREPPSAVLGYMYSRTQAALERRFDEIEAMWRDGIGAPLSAGPNWSRLGNYRFMRNLLAHSLGRVRLPYVRGSKSFRKEVRARVTAARLGPVGVSDRLPVWDSDFDELVELAEKFIRWLEDTRP